MEQEITGWRRYVVVQPPLMILIFAQAISSNILTDLIVYRTCSITLGINKTECLLLHENSSCAEALKLDAQVQPTASLILICKTIIESIFPAILSLFVGPWSDIYGRKPLMLAGYIGLSLTYVIFSFMTVWDINPWFLLIAYLPSTCLGGFCVVLLGTICYITDISNEQDRAWHLTWMEALISVGIVTGILTGPILFRAYGYTVVFGCSAVCCVLSGLYICFLVPETIYSRNSITLRSLFAIDLVKELISTCVKKRNGFDRYTVWCCIGSLILLVVSLQGYMTVGFLFTSARFGWDVNQYSIYLASDIMIATISALVGVKAWAMCGGFPEEIAAMLSALSAICYCIVRSFAWKSWHMYLSAVIGMFNGIASPMIRAILSKAVPTQDTGKIFSLTVSIETLTPLIGAFLYGMIYSHSMPPVYPSPVWLISVGIHIIVFVLLISIRIRNGKHNSVMYTPLMQTSEVSS